MQINRAHSPFRSISPYRPSSEIQFLPPSQSLPTGIATVEPGAVTYTTSAGPDGRIIYEPYRAVPASYTAPSGEIISGIQWVKADPGPVIPPSGQSYTPGGAGGWNSGIASSNYDSWTHADENRRKHEEKTGVKRREMEAAQQDAQYELRMARERDSQSSGTRDRRKSFGNVPQTGPPVTFPLMGGGTGYPMQPAQIANYPPNPYSEYTIAHTSSVGSAYSSNGHNRNPSAGRSNYDELAKQFVDLDLDRKKDERERKASGPRRYNDANSGGYERPRAVSSNYDRNAYAPASNPFANPNAKNAPAYPAYPNTSYIVPSPNMRPGEIPYASTGPSGYPTPNPAYNSSPSMGNVNLTRSTTPFGNPGPQVYPRGHVLEGQPIPTANSNPRSRGPSRAPSPNPYTSQIGKSPRVPIATMPAEPQQLPAPEAFSRPINGSNLFMPFEKFKIQDMEDLYDKKVPKMPAILASHDIYPEDWKRCMQDLFRSWTGQLPVPSFGTEGQPRRSTLAADLIDLWNESFFFNRGVELMLYKGKERRTGAQAGTIDKHLPQYDEDDDDDSSSSSSSSESEPDYNRMSDPYGRPVNQMAEVQEARRRHHEEKMERRRRRREKRARRKAKAKAKTYSVYIACLSRGAPPAGYMGGPQVVAPGSYGAMSSNAAAAGYSPMGNYAPAPAYTPAFTPAGYGPPVGIPKTRSHGYGGNY